MMNCRLSGRRRSGVITSAPNAAGAPVGRHSRRTLCCPSAPEYAVRTRTRHGWCSDHHRSVYQCQRPRLRRSLPVQCIYEFDPVNNVLVSEIEAGSGVVETSHSPNADAIAIFGDSSLYVSLDECTFLHGELPTRRVPCRGDLLRRTPPERNTRDQVQLERSQHRPRPHVLHRAQQNSLCRLKSAHSRRDPPPTRLVVQGGKPAAARCCRPSPG